MNENVVSLRRRIGDFDCDVESGVCGRFVAILDLAFIEDTGKTAGVMCFGDAEDDCAEWATYYLFEATVIKVINGELADTPFPVLLGAHALKQQDFYDVVALLERREGGDPDEPQYRVTQWGERLSMYCFARPDGEKVDLAVELNGAEQLKCFDPERY